MAFNRAYIFDFDETLVKTEARIHVYKKGIYIKSIDPREYNFYKRSPGETLDFADFKDPELILHAQKYKMWPVIYNVNKAIKEKRSTSEIYILTARSAIVQSAIYEFFKSNGIDIRLENILTIGDDEGKINIALEKRKLLKKLKERYDDVIFFDDDVNNIKLAGSIPGIKTRLVEDVGAPMATLGNTPGMGNAVPAGPNNLGSGDLFGSSFNKKPYTQSGKKKRKIKRKTKKVSEAFSKDSDAVKDMGIGVQGLGDYTLEEAAENIWRDLYPKVVRMINYTKRSGHTYLMSPYNITKEGCDNLGLTPNDFTFKILVQEVQSIIDFYIKKKLIDIEGEGVFKPNVRYLRVNESNLNPYDKIGMDMAKKMKIKLPFKKKKEKNNQNAIKQQKFEHQIITFNDFIKEAFVENTDPIEDMGIGYAAYVEELFNKLNIHKHRYKIEKNVVKIDELHLPNYNKDYIELPDKLIVMGSIDLVGAKIKELPKTLIVGGYLDIEETEISKLPDNLRVDEFLAIRYTHITKFPKNLYVGGDIYVENIKTIPPDAHVAGKLRCE